MKKIVRNTFYTGLWLLISSKTFANIDFWAWKVQEWIKWDSNTADVTIQNVLSNFFTFLYIIAVVFIIYAGFLILTAAWDDEKLKKWKTIMIQSVIWLVVIWLASSIVGWVIKVLYWQ